MILLAQGSGTVDLQAGPTDIPLNGSGAISDTGHFANPSNANGLRLRVLVKFTNLTIGAVIDYVIKLGAGNSTSKTVHELSGSFTATDLATPWLSKEIIMSRAGTTWDYLEIAFTSDQADTAVAVLTDIYSLDSMDENGRVNVGSMLDVAVTLTNNQLNANAAQVAGATPADGGAILIQVDKLVAAHILMSGTIEVTDRTATTLQISSAPSDGNHFPGGLLVFPGETEPEYLIVRTITEYNGAEGIFTFAPAADRPQGGGKAYVVPSDALIGIPADIDGGGATLADNIKKLADGNSGADFEAARDSLKEMRSRGDLAWLTGAGSVASKAYTIATIARTVGDNDGGVAGDVDVVDGTYFATGEINSGTRLEVDATFTADDGAEDPIEVLMWGFYNGGGTHHMDIQAYNYTSSNFEKIGEIGKGTAIIMYQFSLSPDHINPSTGAMAIKFAHDPPGTGVASHVFNIDKIVVLTATTSLTATEITFIKNMQDPDVTVDTTQTPRQEVHKIKGTATELARKDLKQSDGTNVTDDSHVIGQKVEP